MARRGAIPADYAAFAALPVRMVTLGLGSEQMAVHIAGTLGGDRLPLICIAGYHRNMADFTELVQLMRPELGADWPVVLVDLRGRGRSADRRRAEDYGTIADASDLVMLARALGIEAAVFLGQGHGGQVIMALAAERPSLLAGAVLIDTGPATRSESLVRLRSNHEAIAGLRGASGVVLMLRRMLAADYPDASPAELDRLSGRTYMIDAAGKATPLFDPALIERLKGLAPDDVLVPQWQLFEVLTRTPLMLLRTEFTDQLPIAALEEMVVRRSDAATLTIAREGSPALLAGSREISAIANFIRRAARPLERPARRA